MKRGIITVERTVWCARSRGAALPFQTASTVGSPHGCIHHFQSSLPRISRDARALGWLYTHHYGWLCPPCAVAYRQRQEDAMPHRAQGKE